MSTTELGYRMVDADQHLYESADAFTKHLDPAFAERFYWVTTDRGHRKIVIDDVVYQFVRNPTFDPCSVPGAEVEMYRHERTREELAHDTLAGNRIVEPLANRPEYQDKDARIARLDQQGVEHCVLIPTLCSGFEQAMAHTPDLSYAVMDAYNRWMLDAWPFGYQGRLWSMPSVSLVDPDRALEQVELGVAHGARAVLLRAAPVPCPDGFLSPGDERFDRVWSRLVEADLGVVIHAADSGYSEASGKWRSSRDDTGRGSLRQPILGKMVDSPRAIADMVLALIAHGTFRRHPGLRVMSVENGSEWLPPLIASMKKWWFQSPGSFQGNPVEDFRRHVWISPFWEEDLVELAQLVSVDRLCAGSDWPHPEGLPEPTEYVDGTKSFSDEEQHKIMRTNTLEFLGLPSNT